MSPPAREEQKQAALGPPGPSFDSPLNTRIQRAMNSHASRNLLAQLFLYLAILCSSFDIFLVIEVGMTIRATYILLVPTVLIALSLVITRRRVVIPLGLGLLLAWTAFVILFVPRSGLHLRGIAYAALLVYFVAALSAIVQVIRSVNQLSRLVRFYLLSFALVGLFGIVQFLLPLVGLPGILVQQWWINDSLPRSNGFSFEPSYFATYLLPGWVLMAFLLQTQSRLIQRRWQLYLLFTIVTIAMVVSSSRMGLAMMGVYFVYFPVKVFWGAVRGRAYSRPIAYSAVGIAGVAALLILIFATGTEKLFLEGTGFAGTTSHSTEIRLNDLEDTLSVFAQSPLLGYSLGGVAPAIASYRGNSADTLSEVQRHEGMSIFAEVLAASGIIGFLPFLAYMLLLAIAPLRLAASVFDREQRLILIGLTVAFIFQLVLLQLNQNVLRPYFWIHIAILSAAYSVARANLNRRVAAT